MDLLKVYPSGRVTASTRKRFNPEPLPSPYKESDSDGFHLRQMHLHGLEAMRSARNAVENSGFVGLSSVSNLSIDAESASPPLKTPRGSNGISSFSRQRVKDAATLLEKEHGRNQLSFITHTIPDHAITYVHENWTKIVANLRRRYIRALKRAGLSEDIVMVSEYQEERFKKQGNAVLHLHIVLQGRTRYGHWKYSKEYYKQCWRECCQEYSNQREDDGKWNAASRIESIRKSCSNYLGKYMSKGVQAIDSIRAVCPDAYIPPSWHVLSQRLRIAVKRAIRHYEGKTASELFEWLSSEATTLLRFNRYIKIPTTDGRGLVVGWYGDLRDKCLFESVVLL